MPHACVDRYLSAALLAAMLLPASAHADYVYRYTGNPFQQAYTAILPYDHPDTGSMDYRTEVTYHSSVISAEIRTRQLFSAGAGLGDVVALTLYGQEGDGAVSLSYPFPEVSHPDPTGYYPTFSGALQISAVDGAGLPTAWTIFIDRYVFLGNRGHDLQLATSTAKDEVSGYHEPFIGFQGALLDQPGVWQVSAVPEAHSAAMLLTGLGLVGCVAARRRRPLTCRTPAT